MPNVGVNSHVLEFLLESIPAGGELVILEHFPLFFFLGDLGDPLEGFSVQLHVRPHDRDCDRVDALVPMLTRASVGIYQAPHDYWIGSGHVRFDQLLNHV